MNKRSVLGRGLEALIEPVSTPSGESIRQVPIENIQPNPYQPRQEFDPEKLAELATSIKEHGIIQPLVARQEGTMYTLVAGERRWRAARQAGLTHVPVIIRHLGDEQLMMLALIENLQRENLNPIEEAEAYQRLIDEFSLTQEELAQTLGKSRPAIANALRLPLCPRKFEKVFHVKQFQQATLEPCWPWAAPASSWKLIERWFGGVYQCGPLRTWCGLCWLGREPVLR